MELGAARMPIVCKSASRSCLSTIYGRYANVGNKGGAVTGPDTEQERAIGEPCLAAAWSTTGRSR